MTVLTAVVCGIAGLAVGPWLNKLIVRVPDGQPVRTPATCPDCDAVVALADNVPVVSWARTGGRCRSCAEPTPLGFLLVELANGLLWGLAGLRFGFTLVVVPYLLLFSVLLVQAVIDLELFRLPDKITLPALWGSAALIPLVSLLVGEPDAIIGALVGGIGYYVFLFVPFFIYPKGMGFGDVKLAALMGLYLGWINPILVFIAALISCVIGVAVGGALYFLGGRRSREFAFGPWLALGCVIAILASDLFLSG